MYASITVETQHIKLLERFTVVVYYKASNQESVNEAKRELFCQNKKTMEKIPPTQDVHRKRVAYQAGIWTNSDLAWLNIGQRKQFMGSCMDHTTTGL